MEKRIKGFNVYRNGEFIEFIGEGRSMRAAKKYIRENLTSTHMGQWVRLLTIDPENLNRRAYEFEYATTIGRYFTFKPAWISDGSRFPGKME